MKINLVEADESTIKELERASAFTWEGMNLDDENLGHVAGAFVSERLVREDVDEMTAFTWDGRTMNRVYDLHGDNRYPDDLPFLSFDTAGFNGEGDLGEFKLRVGARWLDDIVRNNSLEEG